MWEFLSKLFDTSDFPPRWHCGHWTAGHGWLHILSDLGIWFAYTAIPITLVLLVRRRTDLPFTRVFWLFSAFILCCGSIHLVEASIFWWPAYRLSGLLKLVTAVVSLGTLAVLVPVARRALAVADLAGASSRLMREVEERKRVEQALRHSEERLSLVLAASRVGTWDWDMAADKLDWDERSFEMFGQDPGAFAGDFSAFERSVARADIHRVKDAIEACVEGSSDLLDVTYAVHRPDGGTRYVRSRGSLYRDQRGAPERMVGISLDVTRETLEPKAREDAEERMRAAFESTPNGVVVVAEDGTIDMVNDTAEQMFGYEYNELVGQSVELLVPETVSERHPGLREEFLTEPTSRPMGHGRDLMARRKDGLLFPVEIGLNPMTTSRGLFVLASIADIRERKRAEQELRSTNQELEQFAYTASHDLQEPLRKVASFCELLAEQYGDRLDEQGCRWLRFAVDGAHRMKELIQNLLNYSRVARSGRPLVPVDASSACDEAIANLQTAIEESSATVRRDDLPRVAGISVELEQLFQNLIGNALKYRSERPPRISVTVATAPGEWTFCVADNGLGIEPEYTEHIFELFRRLHTSSEYPGTGIGLATCRKIVESLGGRIWCESEPGAGTRVYFTLPRTQSA